MTMQFRHLPDDALVEGSISDDAIRDLVGADKCE